MFSSTQIVSAPLDAASAHPLLAPRLLVREMSAEDWIERHASGTLRKNRRLGFAWRAQYLEERTAFEFGWEFKSLPASRVTVGRPFTEGDCSALTEAGWHIDRYLAVSAWPGDVAVAAYLQVEEADGTRHEGVGLLVEQTSAAWVGEGRCVYALIAEFVPGQGFLAANNPC